jgi:2-oxoglutarate dehydrogenase E2 component (dihydrolipoamide succinyltransferase)
MTTEIKVPMLPESIADATIATWHKKIGDSVSRDENLVDLETDKVMLEVPSPIDGTLKEIIKKSGEVVQANEVLAIIEAGTATSVSAAEKESVSTSGSSKDETSAQSTSLKDEVSAKSASSKDGASAKSASSKDGASAQSASSKDEGSAKSVSSKDEGSAKSASSKDGASAQLASSKDEVSAQSSSSKDEASAKSGISKDELSSLDLSPSVRRAMAERDLDISQVKGASQGGRITKENLETSVSNVSVTPSSPSSNASMTPSSTSSNASVTFSNASSNAFVTASSKLPTMNVPTTDLSGRTEKRVPMTRIRARIAERLLEVRQNTAMLTTFNEINLQQVIELRNKYKDKFEKSHQARLGFMSFFVKAAVEALKRYPIINASIDGNDIVYHGYFDIGVAVSTERGLVVPILRNADKMSMAEIEASIADYANKARNAKLTMEDMQGGTFTITNGGVFGSLLSTPILNSPQSAILGMHKIDQRAVVENGQIVIRPMMYVAMSYDHRIIDGKDSVGFVVTIKEMLEDPARLLLEV